MLKAFLLLNAAMLCAGVGNLFIGKGMRAVGELENFRPAMLFRFVGRAVANPHVLLGVLISIGYFLFWLMVLAIADVSWALPMNAVEYVFVALCALLFLDERVGKERWIGIGLIVLGMFFMMESWG